MAKYVCDTTCTWANRFWKEGDVTGDLPADIKPPRHFSKIEDAKPKVEKKTGEKIDPASAAASGEKVSIGDVPQGVHVHFAGEMNVKLVEGKPEAFLEG